MCGRFELLTREEIEQVLDAIESRRKNDLRLKRKTRQQARPGSSISLITPTIDPSLLEVTHATWGFKVDWDKGLVFNTRVESAIKASPMWSKAIESGRCLIPAVAFFESHATETIASARTGCTMKRPYRFSDPNGTPLLLAGVKEGERCSIVTCEPNNHVAPIHPRMPLVLRFEEVPTWLSPDWPTLVDRGSIELAVQPEQLAESESPSSAEQLSLPF